jgi:hypothetical protein
MSAAFVNLNVFTSEDSKLGQEIIDRALESLNAETEKQRLIKRQEFRNKLIEGEIL